MEDWDAEIEGNATPNLDCLKINTDSNSLASKYFDDDYKDKDDSANGFRSTRGYGGPERSRNHRGFGRGRGANLDWRANNSNSTYSPENQSFNSSLRSRRENGFDRQTETKQGFNSSNSRRNDVLRIEVLNDNVGKMIGRGGYKIKEIQATSGARVRVLQDEASLSVTPVEIIGTTEQKTKAKQLIEDCTISAGDIQSWADRENRNFEQKSMSTPKIDWAMLKKKAETFEKMKWADCPDVKKNFYTEKKIIANMDPLEVAEIRKNKNSITVQDLSKEQNQKIPNPVLSFEDAFDPFPEILETIRDNKFTEPSPIQCQAWPVLLSGSDCIGIAQTGTGKTLAFLLPAFIHIDQQPVERNARGGPSCLVLSPTRELAQQIEMEVKKFHYRGIRSVCIYGGGDRNSQISQIKKGVEIVIGTPGRLNDLLMNNFFSVKSVTYLVLDEADRMLDMGFEPEIKKILLDIRPDRQTVMTSATWPSDVQRMADKYLRNPIRVNVGSLDLQACHSVTQLIEFINTEDKQERVIQFITSMDKDDKLLIFVGRKITADDISSNFAMREDLDIGIQCIHGDRDQSDREQALEDMKTGRARVLIATDVASRGLDIKDLTHVLNYDFPRHIEDYVHRIGRTGRAGRSGCALTFVTREDWMHVGKLIPIMEEAGQDIPDELVEMAERWQKNRDRMAEERNAYGGGRGGDGRGCFKCGKEGHFSRECPEGGGFGGRGRRGGGRGRRDRGGITIPLYGAI